jgi:hypothetical protein
MATTLPGQEKLSLTFSSSQGQFSICHRKGTLFVNIMLRPRKLLRTVRYWAKSSRLLALSSLNRYVFYKIFLQTNWKVKISGAITPVVCLSFSHTTHIYDGTQRKYSKMKTGANFIVV